MESVEALKNIFSSNEIFALLNVYTIGIKDTYQEDKMSEPGVLETCIAHENLGNLEIECNIHTEKLFNKLSNLSIDDRRKLCNLISTWFEDSESKHKTPQEVGFVLEKERHGSNGEISQFAIDNQL